VVYHLDALLPDQASVQRAQQDSRFEDDGPLHLAGVIPVRQVQQDRESRDSFHERADDKSVLLAAQMKSTSCGWVWRPVVDLERLVYNLISGGFHRCVAARLEALFSSVL
jgi:hypothetical protein